MKKLTKKDLANIYGGKYYNLASCVVECDDHLIHSFDCGENGCSTNSIGLVDCYNTTSGQLVSQNNNPCPA